MRHDAMLMVRTDLVNRIDSLGTGSPRPARLAYEIDAIRRTARLYGLEPLERLAQQLQGSIGHSGRPAALQSYLDLMRDAAGCETVGPEVASTYLAALSLRLGA